MLGFRLLEIFGPGQSVGGDMKAMKERYGAAKRHFSAI
jgi:hypothetical protein